MVTARGVGDTWAPEWGPVATDVIAAVQAEMVDLKGEILRVMQAECATNNQILAAAVDVLRSAAFTRQPSGGEGGSGHARPSTDVGVSSRQPAESRDQQHGVLQPSKLSIQLTTPRPPDKRPTRTLQRDSVADMRPSGSGVSALVELMPAETSGRKWATAWDPESASRAVYEALSMALLLFDAVTLPYTLAWSVPEEGFWMVAVWCIRVFWSMDLVISFFIGYQTKDLRVERDVSLTAKHFLQTWFLCDAALVIWDWCGSGVPGLRLMRFVRFQRFARLIRQSQRMYGVLQKAKAIFRVKALHLAIDISILLSLLLWLAHVLCCVWYVIGKNEEVVPTCSAERLFNLFVIFVGFTVGSSMVATLTAMLTQYRIQLGETMRKMSQLRDFLEQEKSGKDLTRAIKVQINSVFRQRQRLRANQVELLPLVSSSLKNALNIQVRRVQLVPHPFLGAWAQIDSECLVSFVHHTMKDMQISIGDALFGEDDPSTSMFFVLAGSLLYMPGGSAPESVFQHTDRRLRCEPGEFCTEVALWFHWCHLGRMTAVAPTEVAVVDVSGCDTSFLRRHVAAENVLRSYAVAFQHAMTDPQSYPSDLTHDIDYNELMFALPLDSRMALSRPLFDQVGGDGAGIKRPMLSKTQVAKLEAEVAEGKNIVGIAGDEMVRFTFVVAIRIYLIKPQVGIRVLDSGGGIPKDFRFIVRLGELDVASNVVKASAVLPGGVRRSQETPTAAVTRIIDKEVKPFIPSADTRLEHGRSREMFIKESPTYGVRTCYSRTCFVGFTDDDLERVKILGAGRDFNPESPKETPRYMEAFPRATRITAEDVEMYEQAKHILQQTDIFWGAHVGRVAYLYAWLNQAEFDILSDERAKPVLKQYCGHLSKMELAILDQES